MKRLDAAAMLRHDAAQLGRVLEGRTAELPLRQIAPELIRQPSRRGRDIGAVRREAGADCGHRLTATRSIRFNKRTPVAGPPVSLPVAVGRRLPSGPSRPLSRFRAPFVPLASFV